MKQFKYKEKPLTEDQIKQRCRHLKIHMLKVSIKKIIDGELGQLLNGGIKNKWIKRVLSYHNY